MDGYGQEAVCGCFEGVPHHLTRGSALCEAQLAVRVFRDDLPSVKISRLRARGEITAESTHAFIRFGEIEFGAGVTLRGFWNGRELELVSLPCLQRSGAGSLAP
jgi:hypothetical protein